MLHELTHIVGDPDDELMLEKIIATTIASIKHLERRIVNVENRIIGTKLVDRLYAAGMKRIYYGSITADVSDEVASTFEAVVAAMAWKPILTGSGTMVDRGLLEFRELACYLNGGDNETTVSLWVGGAAPIAIAPLHPAQPDPAGSAASVASLKGYLND